MVNISYTEKQNCNQRLEKTLGTISVMSLISEGMTPGVCLIIIATQSKLEFSCPYHLICFGAATGSAPWGISTPDSTWCSPLEQILWNAHRNLFELIIFTSITIVPCINTFLFLALIYHYIDRTYSMSWFTDLGSLGRSQWRINVSLEQNY